MAITFDALRKVVRGAVMGPEDSGYEEVRKVHNGMIDRRPMVIVRCAGADDVVAVHVEHGAQIPTLQSAVHLYPIDGAVHDVGTDESAFPNRDARYGPVFAAFWEDPADDDKNIQWVRDYVAALAPYAEEGGYINFMSGDDHSRIEANYRGTYDRLVQVKSKYDPENVFHLNQNIAPAG